MGEYEIVCADVMNWCENYTGEPFHAILTDLPFHLTPNKGGLEQCGECGAYMARRYRFCHQCGAAMPKNAASHGFMAATWDGAGASGELLAFQPELYQALARHLHPGAWVFAFASSRGHHRVSVAMEDSGLVYQPDVFIEGVGWVEAAGLVFHLSGQSFPKSSRVTSRREGDNSPFCQCGDSQRQFPGRVHQSNACGDSDIASGSQCDCSSCHRSDGGQLLQGEAGDQDVLPSQCDAQEHNHSGAPFPEIHQGNESSCNLCQVQCTIQGHSDTFQDEQESFGDASQSLQACADETYHECDSIQANSLLNRTHVDDCENDRDTERLAFRNCHIHSLAPDSFFSLDTPFPENLVHSNTKADFCQLCGKPKEEDWEGHRYGGQILRDVCTPVVCAQKPWGKNRLDDIVATGAGALNIEQARVSGVTRDPRKSDGSLGGTTFHGVKFDGRPKDWDKQQGRWPPNYCVTHFAMQLPDGTIWGCQRVLVPAPCPACNGDGCEDCGGTGQVERGAAIEVPWTGGTHRGGWQNDGGMVGGRVAYEDGSGVESSNRGGTEPVPRYRCARHCPECGGKLCEVCGGSGVVEVGATEQVKGIDGGSKSSYSIGGDGIYQGGKAIDNIHHYTDEPIPRYLCARCCGTGCGAWWLAETPTPCPECGGAGVWICSVRRLGEDSGERKSAGRYHDACGKVAIGIRGGNPDTVPCYQRGLGWQRDNAYANDKGTAARFYPNPDFSHETSEVLARGPVRRYQAKPSRAERDAGLNEATVPKLANRIDQKLAACIKCGKSRISADFCRCDEPQWRVQPVRNQHPTLKSIALTKWLATLLLPPAIYAPRRLLVPFAGTGSEAIGALLAGWEHVTMVEMDADYCNIAEARCKFWSGWSERTGATEPKAILKAARKAEKQAAKDEAKDNGQLALDLPSP